jgi:hypothetical protein
MLVPKVVKAAHQQLQSYWERASRELVAFAAQLHSLNAV